MPQPPSSKPLTIERLSDIPGLDKWIAQPSIAAVISVADFKPAGAGKLRLREALARLHAAPHVETFKPGPDVAELICGAAAALLRRQGLPILSEPLCQRIDQRKYQIRIPTVSGAHALARALVVELARLANAALMGDPTAEVERDLVGLLRQIRMSAAPIGRNTIPMLRTAHAKGIPWERVSGNVYRFGQGARSRWFDSSISDRTPNISVGLARNKQATAAILRSQCLPVPDHILVRTESEALAAAEKLGFPVVVKPANLDRGVGVMSGLRDNRAVAKAFNAALAHSRAILIEKHFEGKDHRVHVFEGEVYKVRYRIPGGVTGDGRSTVEQLLSRLNAEPGRGRRGSEANKVIIELDEEAMELIAEQGCERTSIPQAGQYIQLRRIANVSVGGVSVPVAIKDVHPDNLALAIRAVQALKLDLAAVDLLIPDIGRSWVEVGAAICEVNAQPQFGDDAPDWIFGRIFPGSGRIPVVAILGNPHEIDWVHELRRRIQAAGKRLGFCSPLGLWIDDQPIPSATPLDVSRAASLLIANPAVDSLLLVADDSLLQLGLPSTHIDALVLAGDIPSARTPHLAGVLSQHSTQVLADSARESSLWREGTVHGDKCRSCPVDEIAARLFELLIDSSPGRSCAASS